MNNIAAWQSINQIFRFLEQRAHGEIRAYTERQVISLVGGLRVDLVSMLVGR